MVITFTICNILCFSDTMGNKGAFITMKGKDMKPNFTTYDAVVSIIYCLYFRYLAMINF